MNWCGVGYGLCERGDILILERLGGRRGRGQWAMQKKWNCGMWAGCHLESASPLNLACRYQGKAMWRWRPSLVGVSGLKEDLGYEGDVDEMRILVGGASGWSGTVAVAAVSGGDGREHCWKNDRIVFVVDPVGFFSFLLDTVVKGCCWWSWWFLKWLGQVVGWEDQSWFWADMPWWLALLV